MYSNKRFPRMRLVSLGIVWLAGTHCHQPLRTPSRHSRTGSGFSGLQGNLSGKRHCGFPTLFCTVTKKRCGFRLWPACWIVFIKAWKSVLPSRQCLFWSGFLKRPAPVFHVSKRTSQCGNSSWCQHVHHHFDGELQAVHWSHLLDVNLSLNLSLVLQRSLCNLLLLFHRSGVFRINGLKLDGFVRLHFSCFFVRFQTGLSVVSLPKQFLRKWLSSLSWRGPASCAVSKL